MSSSKNISETVLELYRRRGQMLATAESCTGGLVAGALTDVAGSSDVVERGFVTYSNEAKNQMLGVPMDLIETHGAVSESVARAMAEGAVANSGADVAVAITGVAGPGGGTAEKPVGLVHFATAEAGKATLADHCIFDGDRSAVRTQAVDHALSLLQSRADAS